MNPHHAVALALVGWYLMCPPYKNVCWFEFLTGLRQGCLVPDFDAPLGRWNKAMGQSFDKATDCQAKATNMNSHGDPICDCYASDDQRLKEK